MAQNPDIIRGVYDAFAKGDIPSVLAALASDIRWTEAEGGPYGGVSIGPYQVLQNVFMKLGGEWGGVSFIPDEFITEGSTVCALGNYSARFKATEKSF